MKKKQNRLMSQLILLRIYRRIMNYPLKVFLIYDFGSEYKIYLETLIKLGLIEEVKTLVKIGKKNGCRETKGYRMIQKIPAINGKLKLKGKNWIEQEELDYLQ